jgi:hypothetical protein
MRLGQRHIGKGACVLSFGDFSFVTPAKKSKGFAPANSGNPLF